MTENIKEKRTLQEGYHLISNIHVRSKENVDSGIIIIALVVSPNQGN